jgi:hypothetical protein
MKQDTEKENRKRFCLRSGKEVHDDGVQASSHKKRRQILPSCTPLAFGFLVGQPNACQSDGICNGQFDNQHLYTHYSERT